MTNVEARLRIQGKEFEILVDVDKAIEFKQGKSSIQNVLAVNEVFFDLKKGTKVGHVDLEKYFGTTDVFTASERIIKNGEVVLPSEYRKKEQDVKLKQVIDFLTRNAFDPRTGNPHSEKRIEDALVEAKIKIENKPVEMQISDILSKLKSIMSIKIETKKLSVLIPAMHSGKAYGLLNNYKEKEQWLDNGDLECTINIPAGLQMEFYDKLNGVTHGSAIVTEIKE